MELRVATIAFFLGILVGAWEKAGPFFQKCRSVLRYASRSTTTSVAAVVVLPLVLYAVPSIYHVPSPVVHDEFACLLAGDTFAHFRLTNPPHPLAKFFETFHILQSPTYMSKFPVGLGMALCVGFWVGLPIVGIWQSLVVALAAVFWMLRAAMPRRWALLSTLLLAVHPTVCYFSQTYWGGSVAMLGGALLGGAVLRTVRSAPIRNPWTIGVAAGCGMGVLAISRPFEGALLSVGCVVAVLLSSVRLRRLRPVLLTVAPAALAVLVLVGGFMAYYNWRVTGSPTLLPYSLHSGRYMSAPLFYWQKVPPKPVYPNAELEQYHTQVEVPEYQEQLGVSNFLYSVADRLGLVAWNYVRPPVLLIPIGMAVAVALGRGDRSDRRQPVIMAILLCVGVPIAHVLICPWMRVAYMAPLTGLLIFVVGTGLRRLYSFTWRGTPLGAAVARGVILAHVAVGLFVLQDYVVRNEQYVFADRDRIIANLSHIEGKHLVVVRYGEPHSAAAEWVFNGADVDGSRVVFARSLGPEQDGELLRYYADRKLWRLDVTDKGIDFGQLKPR